MFSNDFVFEPTYSLSYVPSIINMQDLHSNNPLDFIVQKITLFLFEHQSYRQSVQYVSSSVTILRETFDNSKLFCCVLLAILINFQKSISCFHVNNPKLNIQKRIFNENVKSKLKVFQRKNTKKYPLVLHNIRKLSGLSLKDDL